MINRAERRRRVDVLKKGEQTVSEMKVQLDPNNIPAGGIKIGDTVLTQEQVQAIVNQAQETQMADQLADKVIEAWKTGNGIALNLNLILGPPDVATLCQPEHPKLPHLLTRVICEDARVNAIRSMSNIVDRVAMKLAAQPAAPAAIPPEVMAAAAQMLAGGANIVEGATAEVNGALDVTKTGEIDPNDHGQIG